MSFRGDSQAAPVVHFKIAGTASPRPLCGRAPEERSPLRVTCIPSETTCPECRSDRSINWALPIAFRREAKPFA